MQHHVTRVTNIGIDRFTPRLAKNESATTCTGEILTGAAALPFKFFRPSFLQCPLDRFASCFTSPTLSRAVSWPLDLK